MQERILNLLKSGYKTAGVLAEEVWHLLPVGLCIEDKQKVFRETLCNMVCEGLISHRMLPTSMKTREGIVTQIRVYEIAK